jgi:hypothetical protein
MKLRLKSPDVQRDYKITRCTSHRDGAEVLHVEIARYKVAFS